MESIPTSSLVNITYTDDKNSHDRRHDAHEILAREIQVRLPNNKGYVSAKVDPEDYDRLTQPEMRWRLGSSGYPMYVRRVNGDLTTIWMHKLILGGPATHVNGDRLDCRRINLAPSARKGKFEVKTPDAIYDEVREFGWQEMDLRFYSGFANINYDEGKFYSGQVIHGIPHGFGSLYEPQLGKHSSGDWVNGVLKKGMVVEYEYLPKCMCEFVSGCPVRRVKHIQLINQK